MPYALPHRDVLQQVLEAEHNTMQDHAFTFWEWIKNGSYIAALASSSMFLGLVPISVEVLLILIVADVVTGILKSATIHGCHSIRSSILQRGLVAKGLLIAVPATLALAGKGVQIDLAFLAQGILNLLILSEAYSVIGNIYSIRTGQIQTEFDAVAFVLRSIRNLLKKVIVADSPTEPDIDIK